MRSKVVATYFIFGILGCELRSIQSEDDIERYLVDDNYSDSMFFAPSETANHLSQSYDNNRLEDEDALNCFGLGSGVAGYVDSYLTKEPNGSKALKSVFYATSRNKPQRVTIQFGDWGALDKIDFDITRRTIFIVHGFMSGGEEQWTVEMEQAFLRWVMSDYY